MVCEGRLLGVQLECTKNPRPSPRWFCIEKVGRGRDTTASHCNRESGFFAIAVQEVFSFSKDWHRDDRAKPLVRHYQVALDAVLRDHPHLERCVVYCCHCGIRFLTDPRNAGRVDLRCPFGCRKDHRRELANRRSAKCYQTAAGWKKKLLNARRSRSVDSSAGHKHTAGDDLAPSDDLARDVSFDLQTAKPQSAESQHGSESVEHLEQTPWKVELPLEGLVLDEASVVHSPVLPYVRMVASLIEGRRISLDELVETLRKTMRQRSMAGRTRREYVLHFLNQHPP